MVRYGSYSITISSLHPSFYGSEHVTYIQKNRDITTMKPEYIMCFIAFCIRNAKNKKDAIFFRQNANFNRLLPYDDPPG